MAKCFPFLTCTGVFLETMKFPKKFEIFRPLFAVDPGSGRDHVSRGRCAFSFNILHLHTVDLSRCELHDMSLALCNQVRAGGVITRSNNAREAEQAPYGSRHKSDTFTEIRSPRS
jgi:hypothetical protein